MSDAEPTVPGRRVLLSCLAILSAATAVIHFAVAGQHFAQYWAFGIFMLAAAWLQLGWAALAIARPARPLLWGGMVLNVIVLAVYVVTRTIGDVVGPSPHRAEPLGFGDGLCTALEAMVVAGCLWLLSDRLDRPVRRSHLFTASATTGTAIAILLSIALVAGGPEMVMTATARPARPAGPAMSAGPAKSAGPAMHMAENPWPGLATSTPAGAITLPNASMQMAPGMRMASSAPCTAAPTRAQRAAAVRFVDISWRYARRYRSLAAARAAGYRPVTPSGLPVVHYINPGSYLATMMGGKVLDPAQPQSLVYANTPRGAVLVAAMYITRPGGPTPRPGGCLTQWHVHTNLCLARGLGVVGVVTAAHPTCPPGSVNRVTPPMMHIWFVPIPGGPTAIDAPDQQVVRAAERVHSPANGTA